MIFSATKSTEDRVVEHLTSGPSTLKRLQFQLEIAGKIPSLRGVYKSVNQLESAGVLLKTGKVVRLNQEWVRMVEASLARPLFAPLEKGERALYSFTSVLHLDRFWKTIAYELEDMGREQGAFFYNPHNFWAYLADRKESEEAYYGHFNQGSKGYFVVGGASRGDNDFKIAYQNDFFQIDTREIASLPRNYHLTVLGDYVITVKLPREVSKTIDMFYISGMKMPELLPRVEKVLEKPGSIRFVLENSPRKAEKLRKLLSKNFYFSKQATA